MAAKDSKDAKAKDAQAKEKQREAKRKAAEKEKAAKAKEKEKAQKAKEKEQAAKAKEKEREAKRKEQEREAKRKEKEREQKAKAKQREAREKEKERAARFAEKHPPRHRAAHEDVPEPAADVPADAEEQVVAQDEVVDTAAEVGEQPVQPAEDVAVADRGDTTDVETHEEVSAGGEALAPLPDLDVPDSDKTVRPKGYLAEALGKEDAVTRSTQRATLAASYTTRDHDLIRAWAQTRGGRPADVVGTGDGGGAGVLRIEFPDGPGDDARLEDVDWGPFFQTFDDSDVDFLYQERVRTGDVSRFHKIVRADS